MNISGKKGEHSFLLQSQRIWNIKRNHFGFCYQFYSNTGVAPYQALGRLHVGQRPQVVSNAFNCNICTVQGLRRRCNATNSMPGRSWSGRPRVTIQRQVMHILCQHLYDRFATATQTVRQTIGIHRRPASDNTILRRLADHFLKCRRPAKGPILTPRYRQEHLQWATTRLKWRQQQWHNFIFTVESGYCISIADERKRVRHRRGDNAIQMNVWWKGTHGNQPYWSWAVLDCSKTGTSCLSKLWCR